MQPSSLQPRYESDIQQFFLWYRDNSEPGTCGPSREPNCTFVPFPKLQELFLDHERTAKLLQSVFGSDRPSPIDARNISGFERTFAILLLIGRGAYIGHFIQRGIGDARLPFDVLPQGVLISAKDPDFFSTFYRCQWQFCAHIFEKSYNRVQLRPETVLPITSIREIRSSPNVDVVQIDISPAYNKLEPGASQAGKNNTYVLKRYCTVEAEQYFENELDAFRALKLGGSGEANLTDFYGTFETHGTYNVLLEFADQGTLLDYFLGSPPIRTEDICTFWRNLLDIVKTLEVIHRTRSGIARGPQIFQGYHGYINPASILVMSHGGSSKYDVQFKLADLGIDHFETTVALQTGRVSLMGHASRAYDAPECSHEESAGYPSDAQPEADVWSFGCILSDAVTWVVRGLDGLEEYRMRRKTELEHIGSLTDEYSFHDGAIRLQCVDEWHREMLDFKRPTDVISEPIWNQMIESMLGEVDERPTAKQLLAKSRRLLSVSGNVSQSISAVKPSRTRTAGSATGSTISSRNQLDMFPKTPPESLLISAHSRTNVPIPRSITASQYSDQSPRVLLSRPQPTFFETAEDEPHDTVVASPISYARSTSSRALSGSTAPTSPGLHPKPGAYHTQDPLAPHDFISGMQSMRMNSLGSALNLSRQQSTHSGVTTLNGVAKREEQPSPLEAEGSPRPSSSLVRVESHTLGAEDRLSISLASDGLMRRESESAAAPEYSPPSVVSSGMMPSPLILPGRGSRPNPKAPPLLTVARLHQWRQDMREKSSSITIDTRERVHLLPADKRDHVFLIDDASSMQAHWLDVIFLFGPFMYFIKNLDPDGLTLWFTISLEKKRSKATTDFLKLLEKRANVMETAGPSTSNMESRLQAILNEYTTRLENEKAPPGRSKHSPFVKKPPPTRSLSLHIYTDGVWQPHCDAEKPICDLDKKLEDMHLPKTQVAINFVQFGQDEAATRRLQALESRFKIVDVEPFKDGNVWKMLNGAIDSKYKEPPYLPATSTSTAGMSELVGSPVQSMQSVSRNHSYR